MINRKIYKLFTTLLMLILFTACSSGTQSNASVEIDPEDTRPLRDPIAVVLPTTADGTTQNVGAASVIDLSNTHKGYFMIKYTGQNQKVKLQIKKDGEETYNYDIAASQGFIVIPLPRGDGAYTVTVNENIQGTSYAVADRYSFNVALESEFSPFLHPNVYVNFNSESQMIKLSEEIVYPAHDDIEAIGLIYDYVINNIDYDYDFAESNPSFYIPNIDATLQSEEGLCFDYAAVMTGMLRAQGIPSQLVLGYAADVYHAWISVYTEETGWISDMIQFDGEKWVRMDPTFASSNDNSPGISRYIGDGENYNALLFY